MCLKKLWVILLILWVGVVAYMQFTTNISDGIWQALWKSLLAIIYTLFVFLIWNLMYRIYLKWSKYQKIEKTREELKEAEKFQNQLEEAQIENLNNQNETNKIKNSLINKILSFFK